MIIRFEVFGRPVTQGSTRVVPLKAKGGGYQVRPDGRPKLIPIHDKGKELKAWRQEVALAARAQYNGPLLTGPVSLLLVFTRPRPASHYGTGRNAGKIKPDAPSHPISKPDSIKLTRAVEDALKGVVWVDDSQVCGHEIYKEWGDCYRMSVTISPLVPLSASLPGREPRESVGGST